MVPIHKVAFGSILVLWRLHNSNNCIWLLLAFWCKKNDGSLLVWPIISKTYDIIKNEVIFDNIIISISYLPFELVRTRMLPSFFLPEKVRKMSRKMQLLLLMWSPGLASKKDLHTFVKMWKRLPFSQVSMKGFVSR